jgi:hypothetical protein
MEPWQSASAAGAQEARESFGAIAAAEALLRRAIAGSQRADRRESVSIEVALHSVRSDRGAIVGALLVMRDDLPGVPESELTPRQLPRSLLPSLFHPLPPTFCAEITTRHRRGLPASRVCLAASPSNDPHPKEFSLVHISRFHSENGSRGTESKVSFDLPPACNTFDAISHLLHERLLWSSLAAPLDAFSVSLHVDGHELLSFRSDADAAEAELGAVEAFTSRAHPHARALASRLRLLSMEHFPWWDSGESVMVAGSSTAWHGPWNAHAAAIATVDHEPSSKAEEPTLVFLCNGFPVQFGIADRSQSLRWLSSALQSANWSCIAGSSASSQELLNARSADDTGLSDCSLTMAPGCASTIKLLGVRHPSLVRSIPMQTLTIASVSLHCACSDPSCWTGCLHKRT